MGLRPFTAGLKPEGGFDLVAATLPRATLGSRVKTEIASPFKLRLTM
jgi:hypothetical protein